MEITEIKVFPVNEEKLKAFVSVVFDRCFMVNDIKVIQGRDGLFISMPSRRKRNGKFKDVAHPLNNETRRMIEDQVLAQYEHAIQGRSRDTDVHQRRKEPEPETESGSEPKQVVEAEPPVESNEDVQTLEEKSLEEVAEIHLRDSFWNS